VARTPHSAEKTVSVCNTPRSSPVEEHLLLLDCYELGLEGTIQER